jgi:hypothetical protein
LPGLADLEPVAGGISRLREGRLHACEERIEAGLRLGLHRELIADVTALVRAYPLTEVFHRQLMVALFRSGRQAEALAVFRELRELLIRELGVEPSTASQDLHQLLLEGEPAGRALIPRSLPAGIGDFTGRAEQVDWLLARLADSRAAQALVVSSIGGMGGIGKTTLAVHVGHLVESRFPDGQLFVSLRGADAEPLDPHDVLGGFLRQLGYAREAMPGDTEERAALYRSLLADRKMLILLDDALDSDQVRPLLPGGPGSMVLVTMRQRLNDLDGASHLHLDVLPQDAAAELFERIVGAGRVRAEPAAAREVLALCAGLPLAVRLAGGRLAARPNWRVGDLAERLRATARRLDGFDLGSRGLRAIFEVGYAALPAAERQAAVGRLITWYTSAIDSANTVLTPGRARQVPDAMPGVQPVPHYRTTAEAYAWCQEEQANLISAVHLAPACGTHRLTYQLPMALWSFLILQHDLHTCVSILEIALRELPADADPAREAAVRNNLGIALIEAGRLREAVAQLEICLVIRRELGDLGRVSATLNNLGIARKRPGSTARSRAQNRAWRT